MLTRTFSLLQVVIVFTTDSFEVYDVSTRQRLGRDAHVLDNVISTDHYSSAFDPAVPHAETASYATSLAVFKRKLFLLVRPFLSLSLQVARGPA